MGENRFELNWPVVVLITVLLATTVALFRPDLVEFLVNQAIGVIRAFAGIFRG